MLVFWVGADPARIERLFEMSGLFREQRWRYPPYRQWTIGRAITRVKQRYSGSPEHLPSMSLHSQEHLLSQLKEAFPGRQARVYRHLLAILAAVYKRTCGGVNHWIITREHFIYETGLAERTIDRLLPMLYTGTRPFLSVEKRTTWRRRTALLFRLMNYAICL
jgi:hypothetical protein